MVKVKSQIHNVRRKRVVVVAQMIEQLFPTPEISGSNPVTDIFIATITRINKMKTGKVPFRNYVLNLN